MALSFEQTREMVRHALEAVLSLGQQSYFCLVELYPDSVVYELEGEDGKKGALYYQRPYSIGEDGKVTLGEAVPVQRQVDYTPMQTAGKIMAATGQPSDEGYGYVWRVLVNEYGLGKDGRINWTQGPLVSALPLIEGARVFALNESQHQSSQKTFGKSVREIVGWLKNAEDTGTGIEADLYILKSAKWLRDGLMDSHERGNPTLFGLSFDITGKAAEKKVAGKKVKEPIEITAVEVDVVYDPTNNGKFIRMAAAMQAGRKEHTMDGKTGAQAAPDMEKMQRMTCQTYLKGELADSKLPAAVQEKLTKQFAGRVFETEDLTAAIRLEKEMLDKMTASGTVLGAGGIRITEDAHDKSVQMLDDFFAGKTHSFRAAYIQVTGDDRVTGDLKAATRLSASVQSGTFAAVLGDSIARQMVAEYNASGLNDWRKIVTVVPLMDFRTQRRVRLGGYGDLPAVAEGNPYAALVTPSDEEATYAPTKRGGTEDITLEAIKNDDVSAIRRLPQKLSRAAARTLHKFVFDFLATNPVVFDAKSLFHVDHGNLGAAALAKATISAGRLAMIKQQEAGSNEPLGIPPRYLVLPPELEDSAYEITVQPNPGNFMPNAPDSVRRQSLEIIAVKAWTDINNWFMVADPKDIPTIEIGFLDGREEPELFVQDQPNVGSMFSNDKLTYKIRHIYGGTVEDYRGLYGALVA
ncbi:MAG: hypothetical protein IH614_17070 [Desulfuromonadales bacterium]|nr:hypothetical protein [Desulfuromonadales bacterium]